MERKGVGRFKKNHFCRALDKGGDKFTFRFPKMDLDVKNFSDG